MQLEAVMVKKNITEMWRDYLAQIGLYNSVDDEKSG